MNLSESEKKLARRVFEAALTAELAEVISDLKVRAASIVAPDELWEIERYLRDSID